MNRDGRGPLSSEPEEFLRALESVGRGIRDPVAKLRFTHQPQKSLLGCVVTIAKPEHEDDVLLDLDEGPSREEKTWD